MCFCGPEPEAPVLPPQNELAAMEVGTAASLDHEAEGKYILRKETSMTICWTLVPVY